MMRYRFLDGYEFSGCAVRRRNIISFFGTKWDGKDALDTRVTGVFVYYPDRPKDTQWTYTEVGETTGIYGAAVTLPCEQWVYVMDDGEVLVIGQGDRGAEKRITKEKHAFFRNVKTVDGGYAYAVGTAHKVFRREKKSKWIKLDNGLPADVHGSDFGFDDIDGYSDSEVYACGGVADLWMYDGEKWSKKDLPTNAVLEKICCGKDGLIYILTDQRTVVVGRGDSWHVIEQDETRDGLEQIVWYGDRIYVSTSNAIYEVSNGGFFPSSLQPPKQSSYAKLASGDGILVVAGINDACMYNGESWKVILGPA